MSKIREESKEGFVLNIPIDTTYLRTDCKSFSLAPRGQEHSDIEYGKCNYYTDRKPDASIQYIVQTSSVCNLENTLNKMVIHRHQDITETRVNGVSVHYIIDLDGRIYQLVPDSKRPWTALGLVASLAAVY